MTHATAPLSSIQPGPTDRAIFIGQTGTGKTTLVQYLLQLRKYVVVLDPKGLIRWPGYSRVTSFAGLRKIDGRRNPKIVYAPTVYELADDNVIDGFFQWVYERRNCTCYVDEITAVASATTFPFHLASCYARGRERNVEIWAATQRPSRIPLICFSEAEHTYCFYLKMQKDRIRVEQDAGISADMIRDLPKRQFIYTALDRQIMRAILNPEVIESLKASSVAAAR